MKAAFFAMFLILISQARGIESQVGDLIATMDMQPADTYSGKLSIISFGFRGANGDVVTHIDGYANIYKGSETVVKDYYLHTHNNDFSMLHTFASPGAYKIIIFVKPSEHYKGWEFGPGNASFDVIVKEQKQPEQKTANYGFFFIVAGLIAALLAAKSIFKK